MAVRRIFLSLFVLGLFFQASPAHAQEKVFGEEGLGPGVKILFLVAPSGDVEPTAQNLSEARSDLHLEVLAGWTEEASDDVGTPAGGFVPYLHLSATVQTEETGPVKTATLVPHINQSDNVRCARNIALPGDADDPYTVAFKGHPPETPALATHKDCGVRPTAIGSSHRPRSRTRISNSVRACGQRVERTGVWT